jgi:hypothetical protein
MDRRPVHSSRVIRERSATSFHAKRIEIALNIRCVHSLDLQSPSLKIAEEAARSYWVIPGDAEAVLVLTEVLMESRD